MQEEIVERESHVDIGWKGISGRRNRHCESAPVGSCFYGCRDKNVGVATVEGTKENTVGVEVRKVTGSQGQTRPGHC